MYVRVVRFTDVSAERMQELLARIEEADGPPPGVLNRFATPSTSRLGIRRQQLE